MAQNDHPRNLIQPNGSSTSSASTLSFDKGVYPGMILKDRYLIEKELGRGGMGVVYLARDQQLFSRSVVIKVLLGKSDHDLWLPAS